MTREPALLTTGEVADRCGVSTATVRRWATAGQLKSVRLPGGHRRYTPEAVDAVLTLDCTDATTPTEAVA